MQRILRRVRTWASGHSRARAPLRTPPRRRHYITLSPDGTAALVLGLEPCERRPIYGYEVDGMFIFDPFSSQCCRFHADPVEEYGLTPEEVVALHRANTQLANVLTLAARANRLRPFSPAQVEAQHAFFEAVWPLLTDAQRQELTQTRPLEIASERIVRAVRLLVGHVLS